MKISKQYILFIIVLYGFALQFGLMQIIPVFQYWDEFYALMCIPLSLIGFNWKIKIERKNKYFNRLILGLFLFVAVGIISNIIFKYQTFLAWIEDIFINLKFYMGIATTYFLFWKFNIGKYERKIRFHVKLLIIIYFFLVLQNKITNIFSTADQRFGIYAEKIFFSHPTELASATFFLLLMLMICYTTLKSNISFIIMTAIVVILTLRFKAIASILLFIYMYFVVISGKKMKTVYMLPIIPFALAVGGDEFYFYFFSENSMATARGALSYMSLRVAKDTFPFGSGFGTFASWMSGVYYSPIYSIYGINNVWGLSKNWPAFVSDVFWPMIIAQNGFLGLFIYIYCIYCLFKIIIKCASVEKRLFLAGIGALIYLLVSSIAESAFVNPLSLPLAFVIGLCICVYRQEERGIS